MLINCYDSTDSHWRVLNFATGVTSIWYIRKPSHSVIINYSSSMTIIEHFKLYPRCYYEVDNILLSYQDFMPYLYTNYPEYTI